MEAVRETRKETSAGDQPIDGYDATNVEEVKAQFDGLSEGNLKKVEAYEEDRKSRKTLLERLDRKIGDGS
jgi:hypothetical protein